MYSYIKHYVYSEMDRRHWNFDGKFPDPCCFFFRAYGFRFWLYSGRLTHRIAREEESWRLGRSIWQLRNIFTRRVMSTMIAPMCVRALPLRSSRAYSESMISIHPGSFVGLLKKHGHFDPDVISFSRPCNRYRRAGQLDVCRAQRTTLLFAY